MWTHMSLWLDDRCLSLRNPWLTRGISTWTRSAGVNPRKIVARGLGCYCMIWSAETKNAGTCCLVMQVSTAW